MKGIVRQVHNERVRKLLERVRLAEEYLAHQRELLEDTADTCERLEELRAELRMAVRQRARALEGVTCG